MQFARILQVSAGLVDDALARREQRRQRHKRANVLWAIVPIPNMLNSD